MNNNKAFTLFVTSDNIPDTDKDTFVYDDPPPTQMSAKVILPSMIYYSGKLNLIYRVHIDNYFLNCIWRDANDPSSELTANSGTSVSDKIYVKFYVGDSSTNMRLINQEHNTNGTLYDLVIRRSAMYIGELASFSYYTSKSSFDSNMYFENQYTNQTQEYSWPGIYIGNLDPKALNAIKDTPYITVTMVNNRDDSYTSPFWYNKFLTGVSLWDPPSSIYKIVTSGNVYQEYYKEVLTVSVTKPTGPYYPVTLYTMSNPINTELYTGSTLITNVSARPSACVNLLDTPSSQFILHQIAFSGTENASFLQNFPLPQGIGKSTGPINTQMLAKSDELQYSYHNVPFTAPAFTSWGTEVGASGVGINDLLPTPNGKWRESTVESAETKKPGQYSPYFWERILTEEQLDMIDSRIQYSSTAHASMIVPRHGYYYMPSGDWNGGMSGTSHIGGRAIQFDMGAEKFINKVQILFPKSQEIWQPTSIQGTIQKSWSSTSVDSDVDQYPAYWHQGYQHYNPYGKNDGSIMKHLHTLTQVEQLNGEVGDMWLGEHSYAITGNSGTYCYTQNENQTPPAPVYIDANTCQVDASTVDTFSTTPDDVNPGYEFKRFEYGPFRMGPTLKQVRYMISGNTDGNDKNESIIATLRYGLASNWTSLEEPNGWYISNYDVGGNWTSFQDSTMELAWGGVLSYTDDTSHSFTCSIPPYLYNSGEYTFSTSCTGNADLSVLFDYDGDTTWTSDTSYDASGNYTGNVSTDYVGGNVSGEWIQLYLGNASAKAYQMVLTPLANTSALTPTDITSTNVAGDPSYSGTTMTWTTDSVFNANGTYSGSNALNGVYGENAQLTFGSNVIIASVQITVSGVQNAPYTTLMGYANSTWNTIFTDNGTSGSNWSSSTTSRTITTSLSTSYDQYAVVVRRLTPAIYVSILQNTFNMHQAAFNINVATSISTGWYASITSLVTAINTAVNSTLTSMGSPASTFTGNALTVSGSYIVSSLGNNFTIGNTTLARSLGFTVFTPSMAGTASSAYTSTVYGNSSRASTMSLTFSIQDDSIRNPTGLKLLGSSDASTWNLCATYTNSGWNTNATETIVFTDTADYSYYRMVVSQTTKYHFTLAGVKLQAYDYDTTNLSSFPHTYTSSATKDAAYVNMYEWMLEHFQMYTIDSSLNPCDDYIVKEEYYFAPYYDQTDTKSFYQTPTTTSINDAFALYRPKYSSTPQKMINERFAQGRYAGFSVTYESRNRGATDYLVITGNRSTLCDRDHKLFSWRPCHQLYDFTTTGGTVTNKVTNSDVVEETTATINKRFECGVLTGIGVTDAGSGYTNSNLSSSCVHMGNGCENILTGVGNKQIWQKALSAVNAAGNVVAGNIGGVYYTSPDLPFTVSSNTLVDANPVFSVVMANSTSVSYEEIGSTKTTLKRSADFMLNFVLDTSNTDTLYFDESVVQQRKPQRRQHHSVVDDARQNRF